MKDRARGGGGGVDGVKNRGGKCEGSDRVGNAKDQGGGGGGGPTVV